MKPGLEIGNYVLAELLDQGGTSHVWLAYRQLEAGGRTTVAIKFPHAAGVTDPRVRDGLDDEARLRMQLQHSNIPRVIDMGLHEGLPYFVMDYITGCSLAELLVRLRELDTPLRIEVVAHIAREIGYALRYAHGFELDGVSRPVLHRDVAPKSVLLSRQGAVYVMGFGIAEAAGTHSSSSPPKGTLRYESPEHAMGFPTPKSDGWGLGAILWEMIEGRPFRAEVEDDDLRRAAKQGLYEPFSRAGIPEVLQQVIDGLLKVDDRERLTLDEALRLLEAPELPVQRMALADVLKRCFGDSLQRSGSARPDSERSDQPRPAAKVLQDDGPFGLNAWGRMESEDDVALPPPPAWDGPVEEADSAPAAKDEAHEAKDVRAADDEASKPGSDEEPESATRDAVADAPLVAVVDLGESSSTVEPKPAVSRAVEALPATPAAAPSKRLRPVVVLLGLAAVGIAWALWPKGTDPEARAMRSQAGSGAAERPVGEADPNGQELAVGPPVPEPGPTVVPEPTPPVVPEPTPVVPEPTPVVPEPTPPEPAPDTPEPTPTVEPSPGKDPSQSSKVKNGSSGSSGANDSSDSKPPPRKKVDGPPAKLAIELLLMADMELEINGKLFSLGLRKTTAKTTASPGTVRVRWRRPMGKWKSKKFEVEPGASYEVLLDDRGPAFKQRK